MRRQAHHAGLDLSVTELIHQFAGIGEAVLPYHDGNTGGPTTRPVLTDMTDAQTTLADAFNIDQHAPTRRPHPGITTAPPTSLGPTSTRTEDDHESPEAQARYTTLRRPATDEFRSVTAQSEMLLRHALTGTGVRPRTAKALPRRGRPPNT